MSYISDGYATTISFAADTDILLIERTLQLPGLSMGGALNWTNMDNATYRTKKPKALMEILAASFTALYDPAVYDEIIALLGVNTLITWTFADTGTLAIWGWLEQFDAPEHAEGAIPEAECQIELSCLNDSDVETAPVYTAPV